VICWRSIDHSESFQSLAEVAHATIDVQNIANGESTRYRIVGPDETDAKLGHISIDSPLARAILKKSVDDVFDVSLPDGTIRLVLVGLQYPDPTNRRDEGLR
jgi:transcription elongation factor GreB